VGLVGRGGGGRGFKRWDPLSRPEIFAPLGQGAEQRVGTDFQNPNPIGKLNVPTDVIREYRLTGKVP